MPNPMYHGETPELQLQRPAQPPMPPPPELEPCPKCGAMDYLVARDMYATRRCKCGHTWRPQPPPPASVPPTWGTRMRCQANPDGDFHCLHLHNERGAGAYCCFCGKNEKDLHGPYLKGTR